MLRSLNDTKMKEYFFQRPPWNKLPRDRVGVKALKLFLGQLLYEHIRREFPALVKEVENLYRETQRKVEALGASRQTPAAQRQYLTRMANRYQRNVKDTLRGNYSTDLDVKSRLKLRMHLRDLADEFERDLRLKGHTVPFQQADGSVDTDYLDMVGTPIIQTLAHPLHPECLMIWVSPNVAAVDI